MLDRSDITESMITAAINAATPLKITREEAKRILFAGLSKIAPDEKAAPFPLFVSNSIEVKRARFLGVTERRCYYRVQTEDGKELTVHGNDIQPVGTSTMQRRN